MYVKIMLKRVDEVEPGEIIRTPKEPGHYLFPAWAQVTGVEKDGMVTKVTTVRPGTTDGLVTSHRGGKMDEPSMGLVRVQQVGVTVASWELVEVQTKISQVGTAR